MAQLPSVHVVSLSKLVAKMNSPEHGQLGSSTMNAFPKGGLVPHRLVVTSASALRSIACHVSSTPNASQVSVASVLSPRKLTVSPRFNGAIGASSQLSISSEHNTWTLQTGTGLQTPNRAST